METILTETISHPLLPDFIKQQEGIIRELSTTSNTSLQICAKRLNSLLVHTVITDEINEVLVKLNKTIEKLCKKRTDIVKEYNYFKVIDEIVNGKPSITSFLENLPLARPIKSLNIT